MNERLKIARPGAVARRVIQLIGEIGIIVVPHIESRRRQRSALDALPAGHIVRGGLSLKQPGPNHQADGEQPTGGADDFLHGVRV